MYMTYVKHHHPAAKSILAEFKDDPKKKSII